VTSGASSGHATPRTSPLYGNSRHASRTPSFSSVDTAKSAAAATATAALSAASLALNPSAEVSVDFPIDGPIYSPSDGAAVVEQNDSLLIANLKPTVKPSRSFAAAGAGSGSASKKVALTKSIEGWFQEL